MLYVDQLSGEREGRRLFDAFSMQFNPGAVFHIIGKNGAGP